MTLTIFLVVVIGILVLALVNRIDAVTLLTAKVKHERERRLAAEHAFRLKAITVRVQADIILKLKARVDVRNMTSRLERAAHKAQR